MVLLEPGSECCFMEARNLAYLGGTGDPEKTVRDNTQVWGNGSRKIPWLHSFSYSLYQYIFLWVNPVTNQLMQESRKHSLKIIIPSLLKLHPHNTERGKVLNGSEGRQAQDQHVLHLNNAPQPRNYYLNILQHRNQHISSVNSVVSPHLMCEETKSQRHQIKDSKPPSQCMTQHDSRLGFPTHIQHHFFLHITLRMLFFFSQTCKVSFHSQSFSNLKCLSPLFPLFLMPSFPIHH